MIVEGMVDRKTLKDFGFRLHDMISKLNAVEDAARKMTVPPLDKNGKPKDDPQPRTIVLMDLEKSLAEARAAGAAEVCTKAAMQVLREAADEVECLELNRKRKRPVRLVRLVELGATLTNLRKAGHSDIQLKTELGATSST